MAHHRNMGRRRRRKGNTILEKTNNLTEDSVGNE
jgi:hypothetical protein